MDYQFAIKEPMSLRVYTPVKHEGFRTLNLDTGELYKLGNPNYNHILFVREGCIRVSCNEFIGVVLKSNECILFPIGADVKCVAISPCRLVEFTFFSLPELYKGAYMEGLCRICDRMPYTFKPLPVSEPLQKFLHLLTDYFEQEIDKPALHEIKYREFFILLQLTYSLNEVSCLLHPLLGRHFTFRAEVLRHYRKVKQVDELAVLLGLEQRTFSRRMKEEFGISPYQWLLKQKAKHVYFSLAETDQSLELIRREYGFKFPGHFTRFCKEHFNQTPLRIRRRPQAQGEIWV